MRARLSLFGYPRRRASLDPVMFSMRQSSFSRQRNGTPANDRGACAVRAAERSSRLLPGGARSSSGSPTLRAPTIENCRPRHSAKTLTVVRRGSFICCRPHYSAKTLTVVRHGSFICGIQTSDDAVRDLLSKRTTHLSEDYGSHRRPSIRRQLRHRRDTRWPICSSAQLSLEQAKGPRRSSQPFAIDIGSCARKRASWL